LPIEQRRVLQNGARQTAAAYALAHTTDAAINAYEALLAHPRVSNSEAHDAWQRTLRLLRSEWDLLAGIADAAVSRGEDERHAEE
jgi:hypothetical protein